MFGLGIPEILFIVLVAVIILGPEHMPKAATMLGKWSAKMRSAATSLSQAVSQDEDLRELHQGMRTVQTELSTAKQELLKPITDTKQELLKPIAEANQGIREAREELKHLAVLASTDDEKTTTEPVAETSVESDFMHRPIRWFAEETTADEKDDERARKNMIEDNKDNVEDTNRIGDVKKGNRAIMLPACKFLSSAVAVHVTRRQVALKPVLSTELSTAHHRAVALSPSIPQRAWCRHIPLRDPGKHARHTVIRL